ncbi:uncharacterized protein LOC111709022 [Eurytemora carolleeae]|uniref:uncharacterized protein LOC111709022 n=1 Tax=Eurytemora carolleeae TaxID=1294199 RepID=UPI000C78E156|nr:uncharacterized protein LOC111709022 [Eurytemora carolleeae]|eukprot:XP_023338357.1 uncharacterized protein LOC111709022 [Eurytemora affinis]
MKCYGTAVEVSVPRFTPAPVDISGMNVQHYSGMNLIHVSVLLLSPFLLEALPWDRPARNQDWSSQVEFSMEMNPCLLAKDIGPCRMALPQYFFNNKTAQCEIFLYGGCDGNENRFSDLESCENQCISNQEQRNLDVDLNTEEGYTEVNTFIEDIDTEETEDIDTLVENTFEEKNAAALDQAGSGVANDATELDTEEDLSATFEEAASSVANNATILDTDDEDNDEFDELPELELDVCNQTRSVGNCRASISRWYFDPQSSLCTEFLYGGCGGNQNNFESLEECNFRCGNSFGLELITAGGIQNKQSDLNEMSSTKDVLPKQESKSAIGTVVSLDQNINSNLDFEDNSLHNWSIQNFAVSNISEIGGVSNPGQNGQRIGILQDQAGFLSRKVDIAENSQLEIEFSIAISMNDTNSNIELTLLLQPENTDGLEVFRLDPAMNLGTWKRYRFTMKTVSMIPNLLVVFAANSQGQNFLAIDNVFLSWREIVSTREVGEAKPGTGEISETSPSPGVENTTDQNKGQETTIADEETTTIIDEETTIADDDITTIIDEETTTIVDEEITIITDEDITTVIDEEVTTANSTTVNAEQTNSTTVNAEQTNSTTVNAEQTNSTTVNAEQTNSTTVNAEQTNSTTEPTQQQLMPNKPTQQQLIPNKPTQQQLMPNKPFQQQLTPKKQQQLRLIPPVYLAPFRPCPILRPKI